jgi:large subunit ribosomal protein L1
MISITGTRALHRVLLAQKTTATTTNTFVVALRSYTSCAHPSRPPVLVAPEAFQLVLDQVKLRQDKRTLAWIKNAKYREKKGIADTGLPYVPVDETIDMAINLNVDPRKPGQSLRGSLELPHGTGRKVAVAVFTSDSQLAAQAKAMGALHVGGEELMDSIVDGTISVDSFQRSLATADVIPVLSKKLARVLGPRGLMPNPKVGTVAQPDQLLDLLQSQLAGKEVQYRTEKEGILHVPVGKASFGIDNLLENAGAVMKKVFEMKPETYGKAKKNASGAGGKKKGSGKTSSDTTYVISAFVSSTFTKGAYKVDLRTLDPSSPYFLSDISEQKAA